VPYVGIVAGPIINWSMETPGSSADGLGDTQPCVAPFLELENAENQMLEVQGFPCWLVFLLSVFKNRDKERADLRPGGGGGSHNGERPQVNATASRKGRVVCSVGQ
jgi:hypothetical protein